VAKHDSVAHRGAQCDRSSVAPLRRHSLTKRTVLAAETPKRSAAARRDIPPSTARMSLIRKSSDKGFAMHTGPLPSTQGESDFAINQNPIDSIRSDLSCVDGWAHLGSRFVWCRPPTIRLDDLQLSHPRLDDYCNRVLRGESNSSELLTAPLYYSSDQTEVDPSTAITRALGERTSKRETALQP
jgi:hypothetical protein